jgi:hypothetical protein
MIGGIVASPAAWWSGALGLEVWVMFVGFDFDAVVASATRSVMSNARQ